MASTRDYFIKYTHSVASRLAVSDCIKFANQDIIHVFYHTISNQQLEYISELYPVKNNALFLADLEFLLQHFTPLHPSQLDHIESVKRKIKPYFVLSFDDGLIGNYELIAPILEQKGIPAIFFINSAFVDNKDCFYRYKASMLINQIKQKPPKIQKKAPSIQDILAIDYLNQEQITIWANELDIPLDQLVEEQNIYMSSEQIRNLSKKGFSIGAHSVDHPQFNKISVQEQVNQAKQSVDFLQSLVEQDQTYFAFPFTDYQVNQNFFNQIKQVASIDFFFGTGGIGQSKFGSIQRIPLERSNYSAREIISSELLYHGIKSGVKSNQ